jgi:WD40 repeat protein
MREGVTAVLAALLIAAGCFQPKQAIDQPSIVALDVGDKPIFAVAWSPDGSLLGIGTDGGDVKVFRSDTGKLVTTLPRTLGRVTDLAFDPSGRRLFGVSLDGRWSEWTVTEPTGTPRCGSVKPPLLGVWLSNRDAPAAAPPRAWAAREVSEGLLAVDSIGVMLQGRRVWAPPAGDTVTAGAISPSFVAVGTRAGRLFLLDRSGKVIAATRNGTQRINTVAISPDSRLVADGGVDGVLRFSTVPDLALVARLPFETGWITDCEFSSDGSRIVVAGHDLTHRPGVNRVRVWRVPSRQE